LTTQPVGKASLEKFSSLNNVNGYVPQVRVPGYNFPLLMCDTDNIDIGLIGWEDPENSYDSNNMIFDVPRMRELKTKQLMQRLNSRTDTVQENATEEMTETIDNPCFHIIKHWEPPIDSKDVVRFQTARFESWDLREKMLMG
jgi:hypothetical protein